MRHIAPQPLVVAPAPAGDEDEGRRAPRRTARAIIRGVGWALIVFIGLMIAVGGVLPRAIGAVPLTILTGSMQPAYAPGDLVVSKPVDPATLRTGDVITFQPVSDDPALVTHRVVGFAFGDGMTKIVTKGDANGVRDAPIVPAQVKGKVVYSVPYLGYVSHAVGDLGGAWLAPVIGLGLVVYAGIRLLRAATARPRRAGPGPSMDEEHPCMHETEGTRA
jgi:signal peptidase